MMKPKHTIGLFGGSFNPAHEGHIHVTKQALKYLGLSEVWWLVSPKNPLKSASNLESLDERVAYANDLTKDHPNIRILDIEKRWKSNYSYDTIMKLKKSYPHTRFVWIIGGDNLAKFHLWHKWYRIAQLIPIAVFDRDSYFSTALFSPMARRYAKYRIKGINAVRCLPYCTPPAWSYIKTIKHPLSSTLLRKTKAL